MSLAALAIASGLLYYTLAALGEPIPLVTPVGASDSGTKAELESALIEIIDLEADFSTGKLSEFDFLVARGLAEQKAAAIISVLPGKARENTEKHGGLK